MIIPDSRVDGSSKTAPRILIFSNAMVADYSLDMKNIYIWALAFFKHNNSFIATVISMFTHTQTHFHTQSHSNCCTKKDSTPSENILTYSELQLDLLDLIK